jgi:hypothetical protein
MSGYKPPFSNTPSWRGTELKRSTGTTLTSTNITIARTELSVNGHVDRFEAFTAEKTDFIPCALRIHGSKSPLPSTSS